MLARYASRWADFWACAADPHGDPEKTEQNMENIKRIWAEDLSGYSGDEIKRGLNECMKREYPPTLPQFAMMCRPKMNYEESFQEAVKQMPLRKEGLDKWSMPAIYYAGITMMYALQHNTYESVKDKWKSAIDTAIEDIKYGKIPNEIPLVIMPPETIKITPEQARANIERVQKIAEQLLKKF